MKQLLIFSSISFLQFFSCLSFSVEEARGKLGRVDGYELGSGKIVVDDRLFRLESGIKVFDSENRVVSRAALTEGRYIYFHQTYDAENKTRVITEIRLAPKRAR